MFEVGGPAARVHGAPVEELNVADRVVLVSPLRADDRVGSQFVVPCAQSRGDDVRARLGGDGVAPSSQAGPAPCGRAARNGACLSRSPLSPSVRNTKIMHNMPYA